MMQKAEPSVCNEYGDKTYTITAHNFGKESYYSMIKSMIKEVYIGHNYIENGEDAVLRIIRDYGKKSYFSDDGLKNLKFVSVDGHHEAVYKQDGILLTSENDSVNMGMYNYSSLNGISAIDHVFLNAFPYKKRGIYGQWKGNGNE